MQNTIDHEKNETQGCPAKTEPILIVIFNRLFDLDFGLEKLAVPGVVFSEDPALVSEADAVVIHVPEMNNPGQKIPRKGMHQLWVSWSLESMANYPAINDSRYDLKMTYQRNSDVWIPYVSEYVDVFRNLACEKKTADADRKLAASFVSSGVNSSGRKEYLAELDRYLDIHHYGTFLRNRNSENDQGRKFKLDIFAQYKFCIAFENSIAPDYVTEKFFDPLITGSVPVYLGAPNVGDYAPAPDAYINVNDFNDARDLAAFILACDRDPVLYDQFFNWKRTGGQKQFTALLDEVERLQHPFVRLAQAVSRKLARRHNILFSAAEGWQLIRFKDDLYLHSPAGVEIRVNPSLAAIWQLCGTAQTIDQISGILCDRFPESRDAIRADVPEGIRQLFDMDLLLRVWG